MVTLCHSSFVWALLIMFCIFVHEECKECQISNNHSAEKRKTNVRRTCIRNSTVFPRRNKDTNTSIKDDKKFTKDNQGTNYVEYNTISWKIKGNVKTMELPINYEIVTAPSITTKINKNKATSVDKVSSLHNAQDIYKASNLGTANRKMLTMKWVPTTDANTSTEFNATIAPSKTLNISKDASMMRHVRKKRHAKVYPESYSSRSLYNQPINAFSEKQGSAISVNLDRPFDLVYSEGNGVTKSVLPKLNYENPCNYQIKQNNLQTNRTQFHEHNTEHFKKLERGIYKRNNDSPNDQENKKVNRNKDNLLKYDKPRHSNTKEASRSRNKEHKGRNSVDKLKTSRVKRDIGKSKYIANIGKQILSHETNGTKEKLHFNANNLIRLNNVSNEDKNTIGNISSKLNEEKVLTALAIDRNFNSLEKKNSKKNVHNITIKQEDSNKKIVSEIMVNKDKYKVVKNITAKDNSIFSKIKLFKNEESLPFRNLNKNISSKIAKNDLQSLEDAKDLNILKVNEANVSRVRRKRDLQNKAIVPRSKKEHVFVKPIEKIPLLKFRTKRNEENNNTVLKYYDDVCESSSTREILKNEDTTHSNKYRSDRAVRSIEEIKELAEKLVSKVGELQSYLNNNRDNNRNMNTNDTQEMDILNNTIISNAVIQKIHETGEECVPEKNANFIANIMDDKKKRFDRNINSVKINGQLDENMDTTLKTSLIESSLLRRRGRRKRKSSHKWDRWTDWSSCSVTCGKGRQIRWRHCIRNCTTAETEMEEKACQLPACPPGKFLGIF